MSYIIAQTIDSDKIINVVYFIFAIIMVNNYNKSLILCFSITITLGSFNAGYQIAVLNGLKRLFDIKYNMTEPQWTLATTLLTIMAAVSTLLGSIIYKSVGGIKMFHIINSITIVAVIITQFHSISCLIIGRAIHGFAMGLYLYLCPLYLNEFAPFSARGYYTSFHQLMIVVAISVAAFLALAIPNEADQLRNNQFYRFILAFPALTAILQSIILFSMCKFESPRYLYLKDNIDGCKRVLYKIYFNEEDVLSILNSYKVEKAGLIPNISLCNEFKSAKRSLLLGCYISFAQQMTGINSIMYYSTNILENVLKNLRNAKIGTLLIDLAQIVFTIIAIVIIDKVGRKILLLIGCIFCGATQIVFGAFYKSQGSQNQNYIAVLMMIIFISAFAMSHGPVCWTYLSEIMNAATLIVAVCLNLVFTIIVTSITPILTHPKMGKYSSVIFYFYGVMMGVSFAVILIFMKETKGLSKEQITQIFTKSNEHNMPA